MIPAAIRRGAPTLAVLVALVAALLVPVTVATVATAPSAEAAAKQARVTYAIKNLLTVGSETNKGYDRAKFKHWIDANGDCQDTRAEVLIEESKVSTTGGCIIKTGKWRSYYDGMVWTQASDVDIDHLVPLHEAWGSGAKRWTSGTRKRFANDLTDKRALVAVTDNVNQSKGAGDPADWLPQRKKCKYVRQWVAVKLRWKLQVNRLEKRALLRVQSNCRNPIIRWQPAKIVKGSTSGDGGGGSITGGLRFTKIVYNPDGDERYYPNREKVYVKNVSGSKQNLQDVVLMDANGYHSFKMPSYGLPAGQTVIVHSGSGTNGNGHLYARWNTAVWNNSGDTATLRAANGTLIDKCSWVGGGVTAWC